MSHIDKDGTLRITLPTRYAQGSVTERLAARCDALEAVTARLLANEAKLIADSVTQGVRMARLELDLRTMAAFASRPFWLRLRWLALGR